MKMHAMVLPLLIGLMLVCAAPAWAEEMVGKPAPEISAQYWLNSKPLSLKGLQGKIVVVEFWATWCGPCRKSIPHLIELSKKYGPQGVVFMGLSDEPREKVEPFAQQLGMTYAVGGGSPSGEAYGVKGIPTAFVVDTTGTVIWEGHPMSALMEQAIEAQLKKSPPKVMSPQEKAAATALLDKAEEAVKKEQFALAASFIAKLQQADDASVQARIEGIRKSLAEAAGARLAEADKSIEAKDYYKASVALAQVSALAPGSEAATKAEARLKELAADQNARAAIDQGKREAQAAELLAELDKPGAARPPAEMLAALDDLAAKFADTPAGQAAGERAKTMRADPAFMKKLGPTPAEKDCKGWISMARNYIKAGMPDKARPYLERVIQKYPDTPYAKDAQEILATLVKEPAK